MRDLTTLEYLRVADHPNVRGSRGDPDVGCFQVISKSCGRLIRVIATRDAAYGWEHVSASLPNRCPNWHEMDQVKRLFFNDDELAMQLHVPASDHVNIHPHCLHLWRPMHADIPTPPKILV